MRDAYSSASLLYAVTLITYNRSCRWNEESVFRVLDLAKTYLSVVVFIVHQSDITVLIEMMMIGELLTRTRVRSMMEQFCDEKSTARPTFQLDVER